MSPNRSRRETLRRLAVAAGPLIAGCVTGDPADTVTSNATETTATRAPSEATTRESTETTADPTETAGSDRHAPRLAIENRDGVAHDVAVTIQDGGEPVFEASIEVNAGVGRLVEGVRAALTGGGPYTVAVELADGTAGSYEWRRGGAFGDLTVQVTRDGGIDFRQSVTCTPACDPLSRGGTAADLPYAAPGEEATWQPGDVEVRNRGADAVALTLEVAHGDTTVLSYRYDVPPDVVVSIPAVTATAGTYDVTVTTGDGRRATWEWWVDELDNWPKLAVDRTPGGAVRVGCGFRDYPLDVTAENETGEPRTLTLALRRGDAVASEVTTRLDPNAAATVSLPVPVGGEYTLAVTDGDGVTATADLVLCYCYRSEVAVGVTDGGVQVQAQTVVCE